MYIIPQKRTKVKESDVLNIEDTPQENVCYEIIKERCFDDCGTPYISYGIRITDAVTGRVVKSVLDISTDMQRVEALVHLANEGGLSPIHIYDVIEDFFYS